MIFSLDLKVSINPFQNEFLEKLSDIEDVLKNNFDYIYENFDDKTLKVLTKRSLELESRFNDLEFKLLQQEEEILSQARILPERSATETTSISERGASITVVSFKVELPVIFFKLIIRSKSSFGLN